MSPPFPNSYWLEPGRILCGEYPRDFDDGGTHAGMKAILRAGVRVFIDLTEEGELKPYRTIAGEIANDLGIEPGELTFYRFPIRDVSVPKTQGEMRAVLRAIRLARHQDTVSYVHCWGGKGRTGTVAGCALRDLRGLEGRDALALLSERWRDCAKSAHSSSPETEEQCAFVHSFNCVRSLEKQVSDSLLGAAVGEALGGPVEFEDRKTRKLDPVTEMREMGSHDQPKGTWSQNTSLILATMKGLMEAGGWAPEPVMEQLCLWLNEKTHTPHDSVFSVDGVTFEAITRFERGAAAVDSGDPGEKSNGSASLARTLPLAIAFADDPSLIEKASELSSLTHAHERTRMCSAFYGLVVSELLHGEPLREATLFAWEVMNHRWEFSVRERKHFERLHPTTLFKKVEDEIGSTSDVVDTLEAALWVNAQHNSFRDVVLHAVNLGQNTSAVGCLAGGLAGLLSSEEEIPNEWLEVLVKRDELRSHATEFAGISNGLMTAGGAS